MGAASTCARTEAPNETNEILAIGMERSESAVAWSWFIGKTLDVFTKVETVISDRAKGLESKDVQDVLDEHNQHCDIFMSACGWHIGVKNQRQSGISCTDEQCKKLWGLMYETQLERGQERLKELEKENKDLYDWFVPAHGRVCRFVLLEQGYTREGQITSGSTEQTNNVLNPYRHLPLPHFFMSALNLSGDVEVRNFAAAQRHGARDTIEARLTPRSWEAYRKVRERATKLHVEAVRDGAARFSIDLARTQTPSLAIVLHRRRSTRTRTPSNAGSTTTKLAWGLPHR